MFQKGSKDQFLMEAGVPYGLICLEGYESRYILTLENGQKYLRDAVEQKILTADEAAGIESEMRSHGVFPSIAEVVAKVKSVELPPELIGEWGFETCTGCGPTVMCGYVCHEDARVGKPHHQLWTLLDDLRQKVSKGELTMNEAILVFQKAISLNLPNEVKDHTGGRLHLPPFLGALLAGYVPSPVVLEAVMVVHPRGDGEQKPDNEGKGADKAPGDVPPNSADAAPTAP